MTYNEFIQNIIDTRGRWIIPECGIWENHHIVPLCMGGEPKNYNHYTKHENMIWLAPREHYIAHMLLAIENSNNDNLVNAWWAINNGNPTGITDYGRSAEEYELSRKLFTERLSIKNKGKSQEELFGYKMTGELHPQYGKKPWNYGLTKDSDDRIKGGKHNHDGENNPMFGHKHSEKSKLKMSISRTGIPNLKRRGVDPHKWGAGKPTIKVICVETGEIYERVNDTPSPSHISACCRGKIEKCLGYHWMYLEDYNKLRGTSNT